ncbi:tRNA methyltransferase 10 homolog A isoform X2 [Papilio machaon]|uniref:tRNA methyltransferase 10 homolog A isoform X2 n=1 Tax=Papilio machaon TaxID=76193 RepID=UPI001E665065|nr:tRNA methyltransferase 10 homolog A isoform X2 [Papilio machaon]
MEFESNETKYLDFGAEKNFRQYTLFDISKDPGLKDDEGNELPRPFTKNQMRKWLKKVRWENNKQGKRAKEKARAKERRRNARVANIDLGPSRKTLKKMKLEKPKKNIGIIIDLSFDHLMLEKDRFKVIKQILRCYSINRRSETPLQFHITSLGEKAKSDMSRHNGFENWDGLCHKIAVEQGIRHCQLPLNKYVNMKTRKVLTIDHVFEIVLRVCEGVPWQDAILDVLPHRKGVYICNSSNESNTTEDCSNQSTNGT